MARPWCRRTPNPDNRHNSMRETRIAHRRLYTCHFDKVYRRRAAERSMLIEATVDRLPRSQSMSQTTFLPTFADTRSRLNVISHTAFQAVIVYGRRPATPLFIECEHKSTQREES